MIGICEYLSCYDYLQRSMKLLTDVNNYKDYPVVL